MTAINVVLFRHSPRPVELWHLNGHDVIILAHESSRARYDSEPVVDEKMVRFLVDFEVPTLFKALRDIAQKYTIRSVSTLGEEDMMTAGFLEEFFVKGISEYVAGTLFKDKLFMRSALEGQIPQPKFRGLEEFIGTREQLLDEGFDLVKPRRDAGAKGVYLLKDIDDDEFETIPLTDYIAESFVQTQRMVTCDGFAVGYDVCHFYVHEYDATVLGSLATRDGIAVFTSKVYDESASLLKTLFDYSLLVLEIIGSCNRVNPFHFEWFISESGAPIFCEVGRRFGGMGIPRIARYAFDAPILEDYWSAMVGKEKMPTPLTGETLVYPKRRAICYARYRVKGEVIDVPTREDFSMAENAWIFVKPGDKFSENAKIVTDDAAILELIGTDAKDVQIKLAQACSILDERLLIQ